MNVPFIHTMLLIDHLLKAGKGDLVSYMVYPGELHYFDRSFVVRECLAAGLRLLQDQLATRDDVVELSSGR